MYKKRGLADSDRYYSSAISNRCWEVCLPRPLTLGQMHEHGKINDIRLGDTKDILLVRKARFNEYRCITGYNFFPAFIFRQSISPFWVIVCTHWQDELIAYALVMLTVPIADNQLSRILSDRSR